MNEQVSKDVKEFLKEAGTSASDQLGLALVGSIIGGLGMGTASHLMNNSDWYKRWPNESYYMGPMALSGTLGGGLMGYSLA